MLELDSPSVFRKKFVSVFRPRISSITGVLYELRPFHPTIDSVGVLKEETSQKKWLLFLQISLLSYTKHGSKLSDALITPKSKPKELKESSTNTLLEYYTSLANIHKLRILLAYLSTQEVFEPTRASHKSKVMLEQLQTRILLTEHKNMSVATVLKSTRLHTHLLASSRTIKFM